MSASDNKKIKRRKCKKSTVVKNTPSVPPTYKDEQEQIAPILGTEDLEKIERLMDAKEESLDSTPMMDTFPRGPNPYLDRCLLCSSERLEAVGDQEIAPSMEELVQSSDNNAFSSFPSLYVCASCQMSDSETVLYKKTGPVDTHLLFENLDLQFDAPAVPSVDFSPITPELSPVNRMSPCTCDSCVERRNIEQGQSFDSEELKCCWMELKRAVRLYYREGNTGFIRLSQEERNAPLPEEGHVKDLVHKLCSKDPHQLFLKLESQAREFVLDKKIKLLSQLKIGHDTPAKAKQFVSLLLEEYDQLCSAARRLSILFAELEQEHLKKFNVTLHLLNQYLFHSIAYTNCTVQENLPNVIAQLRLGAASSESYNEDTYPNLLHSYLKFDNEMSLISVLWRECQQLIEAYNEEQAAQKVKQKMFKADLEFFKTQRRLLEQHVLKTNPKATFSHSVEAQFTETMRNLLHGTKPTPDECHCSRCNTKRCPCDECTITHMITCGIINPEELAEAETLHTQSFLHDANRYVIDVTPPSISSTSSSSGSSSPIMERERFTLPFEDCLDTFDDGEEIREELDGQSQSDAEEDDDDDDDDDCDEDDDDLDSDDEEQETRVLEESSRVNELIENVTNKIDQTVIESWPEVKKMPETCDCYHCATQAKVDQMIKLDENQCQCHVCLQQQGKTVSTALPQHIPITPRPAELNLYPHIHGSSGLHGRAGHVRPILQPQLYDLHVPLRQQQKGIITPESMDVKMDFESEEGFHKHLAHAYGEWDSSYDTPLLLGAHQYGVPGSTFNPELLPPPPLPSTGFMPDELAVTCNTLPATSAFKFAAPSSNTQQIGASVAEHLSSAATALLTTDQQAGMITASCTHPVKCSIQQQQQLLSAKYHAATICNRPATMGGNLPQKFDKLHQAPLPLPPPTHNQICKKHPMSSLGKYNSLPPHNHVPPSSVALPHQLPVNMQSQMLHTGTAAQNAASNTKEDAAKMLKNFTNRPRNALCNHGNAHNNIVNGYPPHGTDGHAAVTLPNAANHLTTGSSQVGINESEFDGQPDENYDSVDDSCSEQSSSTSNSTTQKEGKYCDCCYCEFFGHGSPPVAPTSKNYPEMRDKLRLRLKKKNDAAKTDEGEDFPEMNTMCTNNNNKDPMGQKGLDELIRFINGSKEGAAEKQAKAKAAKRARQKLRKAEEKAKHLLAEKLKHEQELMARNHHNNNSSGKLKPSCNGASPDTLAEDENSAKSVSNNAQKKKRGKHKASEDFEEESRAAKSAKESTNSPVPQRAHLMQSAVVSSPSKSESPSLHKAVQLKAKTNVVKAEVLDRKPASTKPASSTSTQAGKSGGNVAQIVEAKKFDKEVPRQVIEKVMNLKDAKETSRKPQVASSSFVGKTEAKSNQTSSPRSAPAQQSPRNIVTAKKGQNSSTSSPVENRKRSQDNAYKTTAGKSVVKRNLNEALNSDHDSQNSRKELLIANDKVHKNNSILSITNQNKIYTNHSTTPAQNGLNEIANHVLQNTRKIGGVGKEEKTVIRNGPINNILPKTNSNNRKVEKNVTIDRNKPEGNSPRNQDQIKTPSGKNKKGRRRGRNPEDVNYVDEVFMPKCASDIDSEMDDVEKELEEFKRFCLITPRSEKLQVNVNLKDIFSKKKSGLGCS